MEIDTLDLTSSRKRTRVRIAATAIAALASADGLVALINLSPAGVIVGSVAGNE